MKELQTKPFSAFVALQVLSVRSPKWQVLSYHFLRSNRMKKAVTHYGGHV
jgi:hypothetical protein